MTKGPCNYMVLRKDNSKERCATSETGWCTESDARACFKMLCESYPRQSYMIAQLVCVEAYMPGAERPHVPAFAFARRKP